MDNTEVTIDEAAVDAAITEAEREYEQNGELFDAKETLAELREKYFG